MTTPEWIVLVSGIIEIAAFTAAILVLAYGCWKMRR